MTPQFFPRHRRALRILAVSAAVLAGVLLLLWLMRMVLAEWAIERAVDGFGLGPSEVEISHMGLSGAEMRLVSSAAGTIERIGVRYRIGGLLRGRIHRMTVDGARLRFAWKDGRLVPEIASSDGPLSLPVERIDIARSSLTLGVDGQDIVADLAGTLTGGGAGGMGGMGGMGGDVAVTVRAPQGRLAGRMAGTMTPDGALDGAFTVSSGEVSVGTVKADGLSGRVNLATGAKGLESVEADLGFAQVSSGAGPLGAGRMTASFRQPGGDLTLTVDSAPVAVRLRADGGTPDKGVPFSLTGTADSAFLAGLAGAVRQAGGSVRIEASGTAPPAASLPEAFMAAPEAWLASAAADAKIEGTAEDLEIPGAVAVDRAVLSLQARLAGGSLAVATPGGIRVTGMELDPSLAPKDSLFAGKSSLTVTPTASAEDFLLVNAPGGVLDRLGLGGTVAYRSPEIEIKGDIDARATVDALAERTAGAKRTGSVTMGADVAVTLSGEGARSSADLSLEGTYAADDDMLALTFGKGGLTLRDVRWGDTVSLPGTSRAAIQPGASVVRDRRTGEITASAAFQPFTWNARMRREGAEPGKVTVAAGRLAVDKNADGLKAVLERARIEMPDSGVAARGISATVTAAGEAVTVHAAAADLRGTGEPALFSSLKADLNARLAGAKADFTAAVTGAGKALNLTAKGVHDLDSGKGTAAVALTPIDLSAPGLLQALSPRFAAGIERASGTVAGEGSVHWGERARPGTLALSLKGVALNGASINLSGLDGDIRLDSLAPLTSPPGQTVSGALQLPTVNQVPFEVAFRLLPEKLVIEKASATVFDGQFTTENAEIDAATGDGRVELKVSDINLETAFKVLDLEQIKGTGRIGGVLPLRIKDGHVSIEKGHLETSVPGTLQVGVKELADQLQAYGENVDMAFRALTDFHYNRLTIDAEKPYTGTGKALFRLDGHNPAVMDSQPFVFNISLETDFDYLTSLLLELSGAANTALGWGARELTKK